MRSTSIQGALRLAAVLLFLVLCGGGDMREGPSAPAAAVKHAPPDEVAALTAKHPTLARVQGNLWIVGLPPQHGWERERRVLLTQHDPDRNVDLKVGVVVVLDDTYATAAPVGIVYEEPGRSFNGASAEVLPADRRLRLGRGFGSISAVVSTTQVEITLGRNDGVGVGDVYEVRSPDGKRVVGRVKVSSLEDTRAKATMLNAAPMSLGQEVVYQPKSVEEQTARAGLRIVVCDFEPKAHTEQMAVVGQAFAHDLAAHLREAAGSWQGLEVMQVPQMVSGHESARALGRDYQADIVVWGTAMCIEQHGCAQPVFTVVDPAHLLHAEMKGHEVRFDALNPGGSMERGSAKDPAGLVFGLLGSLAYKAQRFGDAAYYLGRVPEGALEAEDHYRALRDLAMSLYVLGRIETALDMAGKLEREARGKDRGWEATGILYRAHFLVDRGEVDQALTLFKQVRAVYDATGDRHSRAVTVGDIARLLANKGEVDEALKLHREALATYEALGDRRWCAVTRGDIARLLANKGEVDEALELHRERLAAVEARGDRHERAAAVGDIARLLAAKGEVDEALKLHREALTAYESLGDRRSRAVTLGDIARLLADKGEVDEALVLHREKLAVVEALGDRRSYAVTLVDIAGLVVNKGEVDEALKLYCEALAVHEALGDRRERAATLREIAHLLANKGEVDEALKLHREVLAVCEALGDRRSRALALGDIAGLLASKGEIDEALKLYRGALAVHEALGDRRSRAVTLGDIARLLANKGEVDEALELHREELAVYEALGERRSRAIALGDIANLLANKGEVDEALKLHREVLAVHEALGDRRSRAMILGDIANILANKGEVDEALKLYREALAVHEALGDRRSRAVTLGHIARLLAKKGQVDEALKLHREKLAVVEALGDRRSRAVTLFEMAKIHRARKDTTAALPLLRESYEIAVAQGDAYGMAFIGQVLAMTLLATGARAPAEPVVASAAEALAKIGKPQEADALRALLAGAPCP